MQDRRRFPGDLPYPPRMRIIAPQTIESRDGKPLVDGGAQVAAHGSEQPLAVAHQERPGGGVADDAHRRRIRHQPLELSPSEYEILRQLARAGGQVVPFEELSRHVQGAQVGRAQLDCGAAALELGKRENLVDKGDLQKTFVLRRILNPMGTTDAIDFLLDKLRQTRTNSDFFDSMNT